MVRIESYRGRIGKYFEVAIWVGRKIRTADGHG